MIGSLGTHDQILRSAIESNGGAVFATGGDSFSGAFPTARQAIDAATEMQLALEKREWPGPPITVRIGIHTGTADERDGNYFGPAVTRAARIMAVGHGGQILLSAAAADLIGQALEGSMTLFDLGSHHLKDMDSPEHLFELRHPALPAVTQPLATESVRHDHIPDQLTSFVGRSAELARVSDLLEDSRVVTLTGAGGTGKTRLAIEIAKARADSFTNGAWMTELARLADHSLVPSQVADTWGLRAGEGASLIQVLSNYLSTRELLLVIDNCEHVLDTVSTLVAELLTISPGLRILATSRESLGIPGEVVYRVPSMSVRNDDEEPTSDAVALFLDRFRTIQPDYSLEENEISAIAEICRRVDGIPLAIELAVARLRALSPTELAARLNESFRVLAGASKTSPPRQRTLEATIDWSYELLSSRERIVLLRASVFVGGFSLEAIEAIATHGDLEKHEILDLVSQLVDKSLLFVQAAGPYSRFRMLEPIRQYAQVRIDDQEGEMLWKAHATYFSELVTRSEPRLRGHEQKSAHERLVLELDNIRGALGELRDQARTEEFLQMCFNLALFWFQASMAEEALALLLPVLKSMPEVDPSLLAKAWWVAAQLAVALSDPKSVEYAERGLEGAEEAGDSTAIGWSSINVAWAIAMTTERTDANEYFMSGEQLIEENLGQPWWDSQWDRIALGWSRAFLREGTTKERMAQLSDSVSQARNAGDMFIAASMMMVAFFIRDSDDDPEVLSYLEEAVNVLGELGFRHNYAHALLYWGSLTKDRREDEAGEAALYKAADILADLGDVACAIDALIDLAEHLLESDVELTLQRLALAASHARTTPERFAPRIADIAWRAALKRGDLKNAALILGYREASSGSSPSSDQQTETDSISALSPEDRSRLLAKGRLMDHSDLLNLVEAWADSASTPNKVSAISGH